MKDSPEKLEGLVRSLNLVPYLHNHNGATPMEIARDLGYSHEEVMEDLRRLSMSGIGSGPGELIDLAAQWTGITLIDDQGLNKPLRLTPTEANALLLTLESLETMPGLVNQDAVTSAATKLRAAVRGHSVDDATPESGSTTISSVLVDAISRELQIEMTYFSASSDTTSTRVVSPVDLFHRNGETYLRAYDNGEAKSFRLDRISAATVLDAPAEKPGTPQELDTTNPFGFAERRAELLIHRDATWLIDYWEIELDETASGEWIPATMPYGSTDWLVRFCLSQADRIILRQPADAAAEIVSRSQRGLNEVQ